MLSATHAIIDAALSNDPSVSAEQKMRAISVLEGKHHGNDYGISRQEVAKKLRCTPQTVSRYARRGLIRKLSFGKDGSRASCYSAHSVEQLISGR